jgi:hypothetical protein
MYQYTKENVIMKSGFQATTYDAYEKDIAILQVPIKQALLAS